MPSRPVLLCAVDVSQRSLSAVRAAAWLADELAARVRLVHVFDPMDVAVPPAFELTSRGTSTDEVVAAARAQAFARLAEVDDLLSGVDHQRELLEGAVVPTLLDAAGEPGVSLLVTGTAARGPLDRLLAGSVAAELAARAPCPVLVVRENVTLGGGGPIVAGYEGSDHSLRAARRAARLATAMRRHLVLAHVRSERDEKRLAVDAALVRDLRRSASKAGTASTAHPQWPLEVTVTVLDGDPGEELARLARERTAAIVVTGTRGRTALGAALLGSVSADLVRSAEQPVMLVPATAGSARADIRRRPSR